MTSLSGSFAQLMHKAQSMHHALSRYEKEVGILRRDLTEARADRDAMEKEMQQLMLQVGLAIFASLLFSLAFFLS
ncbi:hypothetical protein ANCCAN_30141, partial [Ancylostoma caninum]